MLFPPPRENLTGPHTLVSARRTRLFPFGTANRKPGSTGPSQGHSTPRGPAWASLFCSPREPKLLGTSLATSSSRWINVETAETLSLSRLAATWTMATLLTTGIMLGAGASTASGDEAYTGPALGSTEQYMNSAPDFSDSYEIPLLGIEVDNGMDRLKDGHPVSGVEILTAFPNSPAAAAGLQGRSVKVQAVMTLGLIAGSMFFPPAMFAVMAVQQSGIGQSHQLIIAVDGQRTRDLFDLGQALQQTKAGEIVYLTVVSGGRRAQVRVALPPIGANSNSGSF